MTGYEQFLATKTDFQQAVGFDCGDLPSYLFPYQADIVRWALRRGRAAVFAECGLGKTAMQLEWAVRVAERTGRSALILAPLAVAEQTVREGAKFGVSVTHAAQQADIRLGVNVTNYDKLHHFPDPTAFGGLVLDESSILKSFDGKTCRHLIDYGSHIHYRLACTATPAPNDLAEITNHAEFLGIMTPKEVFAQFFRQDGNTSSKWRLKRHARDDFWRWLASWSVALRKPSDLGYSDDGFVLPSLDVIQETVVASQPVQVGLTGLQQRRAARRNSLSERVARCAELVAREPDQQWIIWCDLNAESAALAKVIPGAVEVCGSDTAVCKERAIRDFLSGRIGVMVTKGSMFGHGLNMQCCRRMALVGLSDSWEQYYQVVRRCWRYGQTQPVKAYVITSDAEGAVVENIQRKEKQAEGMMDELVKRTSVYSIENCRRQIMTYREETAMGNGWTMCLGDCVLRSPELADNSVGLTIFSPPFPGMYVYTNSPNDVGNTKDIDELIAHFRFLMPELLRVTMPGRSCAVHLTQAVATKGLDGYCGLKDFRGRVIGEMEKSGWIYYGEVCIDKNPQVKAIRTKDAGLMFKSLATDSARMHMALADYIIQFRKPGDNIEPIHAGISEKYGNPHGWLKNEEWIEWAAPVWYRRSEALPGGIKETDVLNVRLARDHHDERHLCPLQLGVIERCIKLWSNPGDLICDPFAGIASTGVKALELERRFVGFELKDSYYEVAKRYLADAERAAAGPRQMDLTEAFA